MKVFNLRSLISRTIGKERFKAYAIAGLLTLLSALPTALFAQANLADLSASTQAKFSDWSVAINLGTVVNSASIDGCPFISKNELRLYFASNRPGGNGNNDIYVSKRARLDDEWGQPENLGDSINSSSAEICPTLTTSGRYLFFVSDRPGGCGGQDLYVSRRSNKHDDSAWEAPENLGCQVNSSLNDFTPSLFEDENGTVALYFSSSRPGGQGGTDIYASTLGEDGTFGPAVPVAELNTEKDDQRPNIRRDGLEIFFDSNRPESIAGSYDLWVSMRTKPSHPWSAPTNLGPNVNSGSLEGRPSISFDRKTLYFMSNRPDGSGNIDLYVTTRSKQRTGSN
jgi:Tol biopolymer transport system component